MKKCAVGAIVSKIEVEQLKNMRDCYAKGRFNTQRADYKRPRGDGHGSAKLKAEQVLEIRKLYAVGERGSKLAARFNVSQATVGDIVKRRSWMHL